MINIHVIGIGSGNPDHITVQAIKTLNSCDVLLVPEKGTEKAFLADIRHEICARFITERQPRFEHFTVPHRDTSSGYESSVADWHGAIACIYERLLTEKVGEGETVGLLVWGDPMLYDSTLRILEIVRGRGNVRFDVDVIPGITSLQSLCASHRIPLNQIGQPVQITTGRRLAEGWPEGATDVAVVLDGAQTYQRLDDQGAMIYWGAYLGTPMEITVSGRLSEVVSEINNIREKARLEHGWIMDTYVLRHEIKSGSKD